jgi:dinuclear metal center YbgI/SA1388 family protein
MVKFSFIFTRKTDCMQLSELTAFLETMAPPAFQESYDNAGLLVGDPGMPISKALLAIDVTEEVLQEAVAAGCNLVISHHPVIFGGLKRLTNTTETERIVARAIKKDVAIYAIHTNLDNVYGGVNNILCQKIGLENISILQPLSGKLRKMATFCPADQADKVRKALFEAGAGHIGDYDSCSFNVEGIGSFKGSAETDPYLGEKGKLHFEKEVRIETIYPDFLENKIIDAMTAAHPYEEVAYDVYPLGNKMPRVGAGMIGDLPKPMPERDFLDHVKKVCGTGCIRHSAFTGRNISRIAVCGGAGSFLINRALQARADVFLTGDVKYHDFFRADGKMVIADIGHYESEQFVKELIYSELIKKFSNFAVLISETNTNSVNYL